MEIVTAPQCPPDDRPALVEWAFSIEGGEKWASRLRADSAFADLTPEMRRSTAKLVGEQVYATLCRALNVDAPRDISGASVAASVKAHRERYPDDPK